MNSDSTNSCAHCGYDKDLLRCSRCKLIFYCSKEHQKKHWKKHKINCLSATENRDSRERISEVENSPGPSPPSKTTSGSVSPSTPPKVPIASSSPSTPKQDNKSSPETSITPSKFPGSFGKSSATTSRSSSALSEKSSTSPGETEITPPRTPLPQEGSSEAEILSTSIQQLLLSPTTLKFATQDTFRSSPKAMPITSENVVIPHRPKFKDYPTSSVYPPYLHKTPSDDMVSVVIEDLNAYGLCVLDNFCGPQMGKAALQEVLNIYSRGVFQDGQLVAKSNKDSQSIRSDKIMWVDGKEVYCKNIGQILNRIDNLIMKANKSPNNGKLGKYAINGRTKAMLAVYPGSGTHYVKHVDNPNHDGRCITAIYYLNINWDVEKNGGLLRIFPENEESTVADIAPLFDRLLFFWSDRQNPHEVQPSYDTRYAITLWYFDATERALATKKFELEQQLKQLSAMRSPPSEDELKLMQSLLMKQRVQEQKQDKTSSKKKQSSS